jgi:hypothetical protein
MALPRPEKAAGSLLTGRLKLAHGKSEKQKSRQKKTFWHDF